VENWLLFGCMLPHHRGFRLRVYFRTKMPATLISQMRPLVPAGHIFELRAVRAWLEASTTEKTAAVQEAALAHAMANGDQNARRAAVYTRCPFRKSYASAPGNAGLQPGSGSHAGAWRSQEKPWGTGGVFMKQTSSMAHTRCPRQPADSVCRRPYPCRLSAWQAEAKAIGMSSP
jgi:hypothetical protein